MPQAPQQRSEAMINQAKFSHLPKLN